MKKAKCYNCKFKSPAFKIANLTHHHCYSPTYQKQHEDGNSPSPWETLRVFSYTCDEHEFKTLNHDPQTPQPSNDFTT